MKFEWTTRLFFYNRFVYNPNETCENIDSVIESRAKAEKRFEISLGSVTIFCFISAKIIAALYNRSIVSLKIIASDKTGNS